MRKLIVGGSVALLLFACSENNRQPSGSGFVEGLRVMVSAETVGRLMETYLDEGNDIAEGDTIALIDTVDTMLKLTQARAAQNAIAAKVRVSELAIEQASINYDLADKEFQRVSQLLGSGTANQQQFDLAKHSLEQARLGRQQAIAAHTANLAELESAKATVNLLAEQLSNCFPISPLTGTVVKKFIEPGELIAPGKPLVELARLDTVWVKIYLPPHDLTRISLGQKALVDPEDGKTSPLEGIVIWISDQAEFTPKNVQSKQARADLVFAVKIKIPNNERKLKIGMPVSVKIL